MDAGELRKTAVEVFIGMLLFTVFVFLYRHFNPYVFIGLEYKVLWVLTVLGVLMFVLHMPYGEIMRAAPKPRHLIEMKPKIRGLPEIRGVSLKPIKFLIHGIVGATMFFIITNSILASALLGLLISSTLLLGFDEKVGIKISHLIQVLGLRRIHIIFTALFFMSLLIMLLSEFGFIDVGSYFDTNYITAALILSGVISVFTDHEGTQKNRQNVGLTWTYHVSTVLVSLLLVLPIAHILTETKLITSTVILLTIPALVLMSKLLLDG